MTETHSAVTFEIFNLVPHFQGDGLPDQPGQPTVGSVCVSPGEKARPPRGLGAGLLDLAPGEGQARGMGGSALQSTSSSFQKPKHMGRS